MNGKSDSIFIENRLNGEKCNNILEQALLPSFNEKLDKDVTLFREDGAACHTCRISKWRKNAPLSTKWKVKLVSRWINCLEW